MKKLFSILFFATVAVSYAQTNSVDIDATYFHPAASMYIHGDMAGASNLVTQGLSVFPEDGKLLRLKELLEQQQQNQDQKNQDQENQQDQQQQDQQQQDQQQNENQQPEQENQNEQEQNQNQQNEQNPEQQNAEAESQPQRAEQMSQDEAKQLLDAMKQEEETERMQLHPVMGAPVKVDKDW